MSELTTKRTLVKSPPELWAEVSDLEALARHLGEFGEIKITRLEPETTVVWEGDRISGTVELEPSGWGTKVTLTAELSEAEAAAEPVVEVVAEPVAEPEPLPEPEPEPVAVEPPPPSPIPETPDPEPAAEPSAAAPAKKPGFWARLFGRKTPEPVAETPPPVEEPDPEPPPVEEPPAPEPPPLQPVPDPAQPAQDPEPDEPLPAAQELDGDRAVAVLTEVLDNLGSAHHRPFSRG
jgi:hypothetical protein